jgi:hypothetical protein
MDNNMYGEITRKLGCEPGDIVFSHDTTESDDLTTPFDALALEEIEHLQGNQFFPDGRPSVRFPDYFIKSAQKCFVCSNFLLYNSKEMMIIIR